MSGLVDDVDLPEALPVPSGECQCGRGRAIGTCTWSSGRLRFRAFHDGPKIYHYINAVSWRCADCVADLASDIANGTVTELALEARAAERT